MLVLQEVVTAYFVCLIVQYIYLASKPATLEAGTCYRIISLTMHLLPVPEAGYDLEAYWPMNDAEFYEILLELYRHAAFFRVQDLKVAIMKELLERLDESAKVLFGVHQDASDPEVLKKALHDPMTAAVSAFDKSNLYYDFYEPVRAEIFNFVERCYKVLSDMGDEFDDYLRRAPELSLAILKKMRHIENSKFITPDRQVRCMFCNLPIYDGPPRFFHQPEFGTVADRNGCVKYFCSFSGCFRKITVKGCFSRN